MAGDPIEGQVLLLAGAKASVAPSRLPDLVDLAQAHLDGRLADYRRRYEQVHADGDLAAFLAEEGHWATVGERLGFNERETDAVARAHAEQLRRLGTSTDRREEFETALEIREAVFVGH